MALMQVLLFAAMTVTASADPTSTITPNGETLDPNSTAKDFEQFCKDFSKEYAPEERAVRLANFEANLRFIHAENAKGHPFELGLNSHADLSQDEFMATHLGLHRWNSTTGLPNLGATTAGRAPLPAVVDWRARGVLPAVQNQGRCGSCWTFSAAGAISAAWAIHTGSPVTLSEQQLLDCAGTDGCQGGFIEAAFGYAMGVGLCTAASYPYQAEAGTCQAAYCSVAIPRGSVLGIHYVRQDDERALMEAVAQQPVSLGIEAKARAFHFYKAGVYAQNCGVNPNHAVLLVGYGVQGSTPFWQLQNSWGSSWGSDGFFKLLRGPGGPGECGVMTMPAYPVVDAKRQPSTSAIVPSTSAAPPTTSRPSGGHYLYGRPPCQEGEAVGHVFGGTICTPPCNFWGECPIVGMPGVAARPGCVLRGQNGVRHCGLVCHSSLDCGQGAQCYGRSASQGLCVYRGSRYADAAAVSERTVELFQLDDPRRLSAKDAGAPANFV